MEYILILVWVGFMAFVSGYSEPKQYEIVNHKKVYRTQILFAVLVFLPVIIWAGFRTGVGFADTNGYIRMYENFPSTFAELGTALTGDIKDPLFYIFGSIIKIIFSFTDSYRPFILAIAVIQGSIIIWFFRKYSSSYMISIFLFIATAEYMGWMFNGIRQFLAVVIIIAATDLILEKKYLPLVLVILFASGFHQTALMMIPIVFIVQGKPWNKKIMLVILGAVFALAATEQFTGIMDGMLEDTQYGANLQEMENMATGGTNPIRVLVYCIPAIIAFIGRKQLAQKDDKVINICINMSVFTAAIYLVSMVTNGVMIGRLPIYTSLYSYILLPYEIKAVFSKKTATYVLAIMVVCYLMYYYYLMHFAYGRF